MADVNWEAVGAVGEVLGASVVIITLFYLAIQIRHSNRSNRMIAAARIAEVSNDFMKQLVQDPDLYQLYRNGMSEYEPLQQPDRGRFDVLILQFLRSVESTWIQLRLGVVEVDQWHGLRNATRFIVGSPGGRAAYARNRQFLSPEFVAAVDAILEQD